MALTNNPNKTRRIEKQWNDEIDLRWSKFWIEFKKIPLEKLVLNIDDQDQFNIDEFLFSFSSLAMQILLGGDNGAWQNKYQTLAYERSAERTIETMKASLTTEQILFLSAIIGAQVTSFLPENRNELNFLHKRANDSLTKWITSLIQEVNIITHDSFHKVSKEQLINRISNRLSVSKSRARVIATTEVAQASQRAVTTQAKIMAEVLDTEVNVRWITMNDSVVRHLHANWHGEIFTPEQAETNFNISPWNCRCGLMPILKRDESQKTKERFAKERKFLLAGERR
jgi:SPP1 gp7 family putative phage head morphogenesis protein